MKLHKDACLMKSNLDVLDQYALALHGRHLRYYDEQLRRAFSGCGGTDGSPRGTCGRISVQMRALGLWRPTMDPVRVMGHDPEQVRHGLQSDYEQFNKA